MVDHVIKNFRGYAIEDWDGDKNLLLVMSTSLALSVFKYQCSRPLTLEYVPGLMGLGIPSQKVRSLTLYDTETCHLV